MAATTAAPGGRYVAFHILQMAFKFALLWNVCRAVHLWAIRGMVQPNATPTSTELTAIGGCFVSSTSIGNQETGGPISCAYERPIGIAGFLSWDQTYDQDQKAKAKNDTHSGRTQSIHVWPVEFSEYGLNSV